MSLSPLHPLLWTTVKVKVREGNTGMSQGANHAGIHGTTPGTAPGKIPRDTPWENPWGIPPKLQIALPFTVVYKLKKIIDALQHTTFPHTHLTLAQ